jgi:hypothetical protein
VGSYFTYLVGRIAGEAAVFDSQGPDVADRAADLLADKTISSKWGAEVRAFFARMAR